MGKNEVRQPIACRILPDLRQELELEATHEDRLKQRYSYWFSVNIVETTK